MDFTAPLLHYSQHAATPEWLHFHRALAAELAAGLPPAELRQLFVRIGQRVAETLPVPRCEDTLQLQKAFNDHWAALRWGVVVLEEQSAALRIVHACGPVAREFGVDGRAGDAGGNAWAAVFFEGVYGRWFEAQGLPANLAVRALPTQEPQGALVELSLSRNLP